jgi:aminoglycoside 3-N-acetyltransferase
LPIPANHIKPGDYIPYQQIADHLAIRPGDIILVASDLTRLALKARRHEEGFDADIFIKSIQEYLGTSGTLLIPAYNFRLKDNSSFDIIRTKPITGDLALAAFQRKDFARTRNPLHSFLVWGNYAKALCDLDNSSSFSADSPFSFMNDHGAKMVMIDTSVAGAFTFAHFVEEMEQVSYREYRKYHIRYTDAQGQTSLREYFLYSKKAGWTMNLQALEKLLDNSILKKKILNGISISVVHLDKSYTVIRDDIRNNRARNIARFSMGRYFRDILKSSLSALGLYKTTFDKITNDTGF